MFWDEKSDGFIEKERTFLEVFNIPKRVSWQVASQTATSESQLPYAYPAIVTGQSQKANRAALKVGSHSAQPAVGWATCSFYCCLWL